MKRKIRQIQHTIEGTYAVADDGTWWRILDPMQTNWVQMPDLPDAPESVNVGPIHEEPPTNAELRLAIKPQEVRPVARLKVKP